MTGRNFSTAIPGSGKSAWHRGGFVIRHMGKNFWTVRGTDGNGWGNGSLLNQFSTLKACKAFIDNGGAQSAMLRAQAAEAKIAEVLRG